MGDGVLASFNTVTDAVYCAGAIVQETSQINNLDLRIGIHLGDVVVEGNEIYGDGVNIASRIQGIASPGEVIVSESIYQDVKNKSGLTSRSKGAHSFKNVPLPLSIYLIEYSDAITFEDLVSESILSRKSFKVTLVIAALSLLGYLFYLTIPWGLLVRETDSDLQTIRSLAVLPFDNLTGDTTQNNLISGLHDNLITALSQIKAVDVISRTSTLTFRQRADQSIPDIARELDVDAIVEASVFSSRDSLRINVQLIKAFPAERHLWAQVFDRPFRDILHLFDEVSQHIAAEINATLTKEEQGNESREINPEAYRAFLNGKFHLDNNPTEQSVKTALDYFERSIELDSTYAPAYSGVALVWICRWQLRWSPGTKAIPKIYSFHQKALELDENYPESQYIKALIHFQSEWDWEKSETAFKAAIKANPSHALAHAHYGHLLMFLQRFDEAFVQMEEALRLDPFSPHIRGLYGVVLSSYGDADQTWEIIAQGDSLSWARRGLEERIAYLQGNYEKSINLLESRLAGDSLLSKNFRKQFLQNGYQAAMAVLANHLDQIPLASAVAKAAFFNRAGMTEDAIRVLEEGYQNHDTDMPYAFAAIEFKNLESDPRYKELASKMNLPI